MSTLHLPCQASLSIPVDTALFSGLSQVTGQAGNLTLRIICLDNGYTLDNADGVFRTSAATPTTTMAAFTDYPYDYSAIITQGSWARGYYRALVRHSTSGLEYAQDFTLGIMVTRSLGYSAVYDGTTLTLSAWVEEDGVAKIDYTALNNCKICDSTGTVITGGTFSNNTSPSANGVFRFSAAVALSASTNYIFTADAVVPGPATRPSMTFPLRVGFARP